jgi:hypothetical protein
MNKRWNRAPRSLPNRTNVLDAESRRLDAVRDLPRGHIRIEFNVEFEQQSIRNTVIEPTRVGRREVHVVARMLGQPRFDLWMLVCRIVVDDQMHIEVSRYRLVDMLEEREEFLVPVSAARPRPGRICGICREVVK